MTGEPTSSASIKVSIHDFGAKLRLWKVAMPRAFDRGIHAGMYAVTADITAHVKSLIDGPVLNRRTGRLWRSIHPEVFKEKGTTIGIVGTDVSYAPVHEFGSDGPIRPKKRGGVLVFEIGGNVIFARSVTIPKRPFMSRAFKERERHARRILNDYLMRSLTGTLKEGKVLPVSARRGVGFNADSS